MHTADVFPGATGGWYYRVKAGNGEIISGSERYTRRSSAVRACKRNTDAEQVRIFDNEGRLLRTWVRDA